MPQVKVGWRSGAVSPVVSVSKLLDTYSSSAAAYSLRKLSSTYTGSSIRVRRSSDNTEQNIGFDSDGNLDTVALSAFVGSGSGFVTTWYDQSGNSRNVAQTTAANQPRIVNAGAIELLNGKVCFSNYGQNQWLQLNSFGSNIASIFSFAMVGSVGNDSFRVALKFNPPSTGNNSKLQVNGFASLTSLEMQGSSSIYYSFPGVMNTTIPHIIQGTFNSTTSEFSVNNQTLLTGNAGPSTLNGIIIGADWNGAYPTSGKYQEVVVWGVNKSTDRSGINTALNTYYSVYPNPTSVWNLLAAAYNADSTGSSSLKTSLYAAYNGESNANDSFGTLNGTAVGGVTYTAGKIGNAFTLNGTNAYVSLPRTTNEFDFTGDFSINVWIKPTANSATYQIFQNFYGTTNTNRYGYNLYLQSGLVRFATYKGNTGALSASVIAQAPTTIVGGTWYHIVITKTTSNAFKIYINGVLQTLTVVEGDLSLTPVYSSLGQVNIGSTFNNGVRSQYFNGQIDALNTWSKELTQSEITELYNSGNGAQYIGDNFYKPTTNDALNTYNGTAQGGLTYGVGKVGTAFQFNGTNSYVSLPNNSLNFTGDFSISLWLYHTASGGQEILSSFYYLASPYTYVGWRLMLDNILGQTNKIGFFIPKPGATSLAYTQWDYKTTSLTLNAWNHIVIVRKSGIDTLAWVNGVSQACNIGQVNGGLKTEDPVYNSNVKCNIGVAGGSTTFSLYMKNNSRIDAVNVWNKELSASEITELYNSGNGKQYPN